MKFAINFITLMFVKIIFCASHDSILSKFTQSDYMLKDQWFENVYYDKTYLHTFVDISFKYNRSITAYNLTMKAKQDISMKDEELSIQSYKFASNEYRSFPIKIRLNTCEAIKADVGGVLTKNLCGNFTLSDCFLKKDTIYHLYNFMFDASKFPPFIPSGRYKTNVQMYYMGKYIAIANLYCEVYRNITRH